MCFSLAPVQASYRSYVHLVLTLAMYSLRVILATSFKRLLPSPAYHRLFGCH